MPIQVQLTPERLDLIEEFFEVHEKKMLKEVDRDLHYLRLQAALQAPKAVEKDIKVVYNEMQEAAKEISDCLRQMDIINNEITDLANLERQRDGTFNAQVVQQELQQAMLQQQKINEKQNRQQRRSTAKKTKGTKKRKKR
jgi:hypothetical protein